MKRNYVLLLVLVMMVFAAVGTSAKAQVLTFSGFQAPDEEILNYYDGGLAGSGTGPGPNYGVVFGVDALALPNGSGSNVSNEPLGSTGSMIFLSGAGDVMDVASGFTTGFSFFYAAPGYSGSVEVFSGLDGTGTDLADLNLTTNGGYCGTLNYSCWTAIGVNFSGTAESVLFSGTANYIAFSDVTLGNSAPGQPSGGAAPEPSTFLMVGSGLAGLSGMIRRRFKV
jgi:hypothetical protein